MGRLVILTLGSCHPERPLGAEGSRLWFYSEYQKGKVPRRFAPSGRQDYGSDGQWECRVIPTLGSCHPERNARVLVIPNAPSGAEGSRSWF